jgi:subtilisin family serine protease
MNGFPSQLEHGSGITIILDPTRALLGFRESIEPEAVGRRLAPLGLVLEELGAQEAPSPVGLTINHTDTRLWVRSALGQPIEAERLQAWAATEKVPLAWIGPVYRAPDVDGPGGMLSPLPHVLVIRPSEQANQRVSSIGRAMQALGLEEVPEKSQYLVGYQYYEVKDPKQTAYQVRGAILQKNADLVAEVRFENMPMAVPVTIVPNDTLFGRQWDMTQIDAPLGWDISTGAPARTICILDQGVDLTHPDLLIAPGNGINLGTMAPPGSPTGPHGTACAGIAAARFNNAEGVAGVAGSCQILPVAFQNWTDVEVATGINYAANNGAQVISMSFGQYALGDGFGPTGWDFAVIDPAIVNAVNVLAVVLVAATGNENTGTINRYPARHPLVIACGASDQADNRVSTRASSSCLPTAVFPSLSRSTLMALTSASTWLVTGHSR